MDQNTGKYIILFGAVIIIAGILIYFFHDKLHWIGRLPGDIRIEKENSRFYFPIVTMLLFSVFISLIIYLVRRFF
ncbi:MAG TPA: DUF2905 domain-containing protein [Chitinophagaceae bacterium]|nr:DUF2905 domain-containing protein [Chitinophagaceae bacterium]